MKYQGFRDDSVTDDPKWLTLRVPVYVEPPHDDVTLTDMLDDDYDRERVAEEIRTQVAMASDEELVGMVVREDPS